MRMIEERHELKALLMVDIQRCARPGAPFEVSNYESLIGAANCALDACHATGVPVFFTRHRQDPDHIGLGGSTAADEDRDRGNYVIPAELHQYEGDVCLDKPQWSALRQTDLGAQLNRLPGTTVAIGGTVTDCCVLTTAYDVFFEQMRVLFITDALGACSEAEHMAAALQAANWMYECGFARSDAFSAWVRGESAYRGWSWSRPHEFPFSAATLVEQYERLTNPAPALADSAVSTVR